MNDWLYFYLGIIAVQSTMLGICGWYQIKSSRYITQLSKSLSEANKLLDEGMDMIRRQQSEIAALRHVFGDQGGQLFEATSEGLASIPPEVQAMLRETLQNILGEMKRRDN